mmetsp:Transcript_76411/g.126137  ORF Transcript_76411/g.126137 Transcript_76411/m.126137 type:complete len:208 (+) Transcript_76411:189-812(+)
MVHRSRSMRNSRAPRIRGWKVSFNMVNPTFQNGRLKSAMIGAPALTTPAVHTPVKTVHAVAKVPISKDKDGGGKRMRNSPGTSFTTIFDPRGGSRLTASRGRRAPLDPASRVSATGTGGDRRKVRASEAELKRSSGAGAKSRCKSWGNQVSCLSHTVPTKACSNFTWSRSTGNAPGSSPVAAKSSDAPTPYRSDLGVKLLPKDSGAM